MEIEANEMLQGSAEKLAAAASLLERMDTMAVQYFSSSLIDATVRELLAPWVAARLG